VYRVDLGNFDRPWVISGAAGLIAVVKCFTAMAITLIAGHGQKFLGMGLDPLLHPLSRPRLAGPYNMLQL
jgi:hypothetical protein